MYLDFSIFNISFGIHVFSVSLRVFSAQKVRHLSAGHLGDAAEVARRVAIVCDHREPTWKRK